MVQVYAGARDSRYIFWCCREIHWPLAVKLEHAFIIICWNIHWSTYQLFHQERTLVNISTWLMWVGPKLAESGSETTSINRPVTPRWADSSCGLYWQASLYGISFKRLYFNFSTVPGSATQAQVRGYYSEKHKCPCDQWKQWMEEISRYAQSTSVIHTIPICWCIASLGLININLGY